MGDNPDRKSGRAPCRKGGVDLSHRNGRTPTPRLPGERLGNTLAKEPSMSSTWKQQRSALGHAKEEE